MEDRKPVLFDDATSLGDPVIIVPSQVASVTDLVGGVRRVAAGTAVVNLTGGQQHVVLGTPENVSICLFGEFLDARSLLSAVKK